MLILGIESSCDDTSVALLDCGEQGHFIISQKTASQIEIHQKYGGVVPEIAGRLHAEKIVPLIESVFAEATTDKRSKIKKPDAIAVTAGPGLITGLIVGVEAARALSYAWNVPLVAVNHIEGHIHSVEIKNDKSQIANKLQNSNYKIQFPAIALVVSGGHTELIMLRDHGEYEMLGATKDDAAGECFDKVAKLLGLPYPGGPEISRLAESGNSSAIIFPRPMLKEGDFSAKGGPAFGWSFAGLKTSALYWLRDNDLTLDSRLLSSDTKSPKSKVQSPITINDFCASFEQAIVDVLVAKTLRAAKKIQPKTIILAGGVAANKKLRQTLAKTIASHCPKSEVRSPKSNFCMDNGAMIAVAGYYRARRGEFTDWRQIEADPNWKIA